MKTIGILLLLVISISASGQTPSLKKYGISPETIPVGLKIGEKAPDFTLKTADGKAFNLYKKLKSKPVVLIFYRAYWCPVCSRYLSAYQDSLHMITDRGALFVAVTPEKYSYVEKTQQKTKAEFEILSDKDDKVMKAYHVNFLVTRDYQDRIKSRLHAGIAETNGQKQAELPVPATYIINREGTIVYRQFDPDYHKRARVVDILKNLP